MAMRKVGNVVEAMEVQVHQEGDEEGDEHIGLVDGLLRPGMVSVNSCDGRMDMDE